MYLQSELPYKLHIPQYDVEPEHKWPQSVDDLLDQESSAAPRALLVVVRTPSEVDGLEVKSVWAYLGINKHKVDWVILLVQSKELPGEDPPFIPAISAERRGEGLLYKIDGLSRAWVEDQKGGRIGFEYNDKLHETTHHDGVDYFVIRIQVLPTQASKRKAPVDGAGDEGGSGSGDPKQPKGPGPSGAGSEHNLGAGSKHNLDGGGGSKAKKPKQLGFGDQAHISARVICLMNDEGRKARAEQVCQDLSVSGIEAKAHPATNGRELTKSDIERSKDEGLLDKNLETLKTCWNKPIKVGEVGCFLSHFKVSAS